ncbi:hypothetical protein TNCV_3551 [Trichonephila clavipes]|nr:hypothetical protein TNCV_3551 [Trichonephila clavipes]
MAAAIPIQKQVFFGGFWNEAPEGTLRRNDQIEFFSEFTINGGKPHSCSAFSLLVDDTAPIIILAALCCTESSFRLTEIEAGVQIGVAYSKTGLITVQKVLLGFEVLSPKVPHNFRRIFSFQELCW